MKLSLIFAAVSAAEATTKTWLAELKKFQSQDAKERISNIEEDLLLQKCGGKPVLQSNVEDVECGMTFSGGILCSNKCPHGWRSEARGWAYCDGSKWKPNNELSACIPICSDMSAALKTLPGNVLVKHDTLRRGTKRFPPYKLPVVKFSCYDKRDQLTIKARFLRSSKLEPYLANSTRQSVD